MKLGFIGTGNLASAILNGVLAAGAKTPEEIVIFDRDTDKTAALAVQNGVAVASCAADVAAACGILFVAVKPKDVAAAAAEIRDAAKKSGAVVVSTAAGTPLAALEAAYGADCKLVRIMPNVNAAVGQSMTALCRNGAVSDAEFDAVCAICDAFGRSIRLPETQFSVFTAVAGSAPAFAYLFADALTNAGIRGGMTAADAQLAAAQMLLGSAQMLLESGRPVSELVRSVCSPGGTTIEGVCSLKADGFEGAVIRAIDATVARDRAMTKER
ncbi:MAG: pyrroline-5-carboxylate reductase [Clostridia bacterium]|nr:pyrroline-5-carboxylate reductase [Clostridia bacterium]